MPGYYLVKRYFVPDPEWFKFPHWSPIRYGTWQEARDAYIQERLSNVAALGIRGISSEDIDIVYAE